MTFYKYYMYIKGLHCMVFSAADGGECVLSVADGVLSGVKPPAGDFSRQRKVTKSWLRTNGSKNSFVSLCCLS